MSVDLRDDVIHLVGTDVTISIPARAVRVRPRLGQTALRIELPDGGLLVGGELSALADQLPPAGEGLAHRLESHPGLVLIAFALLPVVAWLGYRQTIPWIARVAVYRFPPAIEAGIGREALGVLDQQLVGPTSLDANRRAGVSAAFGELSGHAGLPDAALMYRDGTAVGANAFALPGGILVVTDQLVSQLTDEQVVAVIAHELGHVAHRHALRALFQGSLLVLLANMVLGDAGGVTMMASQVPALLAQMRYSRDHEREADAYAFELLRRSGRSPLLLGDALAALERADGGMGSGPLRYLSTHPATDDRMQAARDAVPPPE